MWSYKAINFGFISVIIVAWEIYLLRLLSISFNTFDSFAISLYLKIILKISTILEETTTLDTKWNPSEKPSN